MEVSLLLDAASGRDNLLACAGADLEPAHRDRLRDLAVRQHLDRTLVAVDQTGCRPATRASLRRAELLEVVEPNDLRFLTEWIREATLRQTTRDRHLAAFEMRLAAARTVMARARLDTLVSLTRRLTRAGARTAAETLAILRASRAPPTGCAGRSSRLPLSLSALSLFCAPFTSLLDRRHLDEVANLLELTLEARRDRLHHHVLVMLETDRLERRGACATSGRCRSGPA